MSIDAKMLVENAALKEQVSSLIAARQSLVVLNASLAEKNEILLAKLQKLMDTVKELQADSTSACVHLNENDRDEEELWAHMMEERRHQRGARGTGST